MQTSTLQMLGCAFAAADFLFEIDATHTVRFAAGASAGVTGGHNGNPSGQDWRQWIAETDRDMAEALCTGLSPGERRGPAAVRLAAGEGKVAMLTAFSLPQLAPSVSCALALGGSLLFETEGANGLHSAAGFESVARRLSTAARRDGLELDLSLVEVPEAQVSGAAPEVLQKLAAVLRAQSYGGASAARIAPHRFALLSPKQHNPGRLEEQIGQATGLDAESVSMPLDPKWTTEVYLRTLRFTLDEFIKEGLGDDPSKVMAQFEDRAAQTDARAKTFVRRVSNRDFKLVYQPVVKLNAGVVHHYEVLARFSRDDSPADMIKFAEELDLMEPFDLAVVQSTIATLRAPANQSLKAAVNISARSILSDAFMDHLIDHLSGNRGLTGRLEFEVTESAELTDLELADRQIQRLRREGYKVALDDFGAGSASFAYLKALQVDRVKIDGQYVRELASGGRDAALVRHLVQLCRELGVTTIAEMVETEEVEAMLKTFGVDMVQGYLYGKPAAKPEPLRSRYTPAARRMGAVETWG